MRGCGTGRPAGYTPRYLRALFAEHMDHSPEELAAIVCMQCALRYLEEENGSVNLSEAAARFGFSDQSHMNREFRRFLDFTFGAVKGAPSWIDEIVPEATRQV
ncbi:helix-turn-helix domain-containing protein [Adlercreutzia equolifaciens]|uniref:helix-turn-helix domain-containing protein n=1 Tax=Adlercreutzia equolifaciens TaxID=446660 RepID=UPI003AF64C6E